MPPDAMREDEKLLWNMSLGEMQKIHGWVGHVDLFLFRRWCINAALLNRLDIECYESEMIIITEKGNETINPLFTMRDKTEKTFIKLCTEFGLSPSSRNNISLPVQNKKEEVSSYLI
jgi:P27 family predicted phage terminase small subunit